MSGESNIAISGDVRTQYTGLNYIHQTFEEKDICSSAGLG